MKQFTFRALVTLDSWYPATQGQDPRAAHTLMIHIWNAGELSESKFFAAGISRDDGQPLEPGKGQVVILTVADDDAPLLLAPGRLFTVSGRGSGHGIISRCVPSTSGPS